MSRVVRKQPKVAWIVVARVLVNMIHYFLVGQWPTERFRHHDPVFSHISMAVRLGMTRNPQQDVAVLVQHPTPAPCRIRAARCVACHRMVAGRLPPHWSLDAVTSQVAANSTLVRPNGPTDGIERRACFRHPHDYFVLLLARTHSAVSGPVRVIARDISRFQAVAFQVFMHR
jgi:hypothetical protein